MRTIVKSRSAHMRHVSWTHRVNLDGLFESQFGSEHFSNNCSHQPPDRTHFNDSFFHVIIGMS